MASNITAMKQCATCLQNSDEQKVKPGITSCEGCHQSFCLSHFVEHRQSLNSILDDIAGQRDILRSRIEELPTRMSNEHLKMTDDWEKTMLETVTEAAKNTRQQVRHLIISEMERECTELTSRITAFRVNDNCFETDIKELQAKIEKLNEELIDSPGLHRIELNLPTLDCSNMIHTKLFETRSSAETTENNDSITTKPKKEYYSFIEHFITTHQPSTELSTSISGHTCASPTMLIAIADCAVNKLVFHRQSTSSFRWKYKSILGIRWSSWLQQFIVLKSTNIVAVDATEKEIKEVVEVKDAQLQRMCHWKHLFLVTDNTNRVFCYQMNKTLTDWLLLYCWSSPTTCASCEKITAIALNEHRIVLSIKRTDQHRFAVHNHDMTHCKNIELIQPCTTIQALPNGEWLLHDSTQQLYRVIDVELEQHEEPYLSSSKNSELTVTCNEIDKVLLVLLSRNTKDQYLARTLRIYTNNP